VGLFELFGALLIAGLSGVNAALPIAAAARTREPRFVLVAAGHLALAGLGALWAWGELPLAPPAYAEVGSPVLGLVLAAVVLLLAATLVPRRD
jgi:hypothetical protein